jgi:hypothetical protein
MKYKTNKNKTYIIVGVIALVAIAAGIFFYFLGAKEEPKRDLSAFAQCLSERGVAMYGASWCSHCQSQKALFGDAFKYVKYVECPDNIPLCTEKNIQGFPTWIFSGSTTLIGEQSLEKLASVSGCPLP